MRTNIPLSLLGLLPEVAVFPLLRLSDRCTSTVTRYRRPEPNARDALSDNGESKGPYLPVWKMGVILGMISFLITSAALLWPSHTCASAASMTSSILAKVGT
jgi:hypothetical protein